MKQIKLTPKTSSLATLFKQKAIQFDNLLGENIPKEDLEAFFRVIDQMKINITK